MNNLRKFATEAEYSAATLNYPAVSWVVSGDTVHYDKTSGETPTSAPAVKFAFTTDTCGGGQGITLAADAGMLDIVSAITINGVDYEPLDSNIYYELASNTDYLIEYKLMDDATDMGYQFSYVQAPSDCSYGVGFYDLLFPEQVTRVESISNMSINNIIFLSETPPEVNLNSSTMVHGYVYVPDSAVNTYKTAWYNKEIDNYIKPLSEYSGNLPI